MPVSPQKPPDAAGEFDALTEHMVAHAQTLATENATEDDLDARVVALTKATLKPVD